MSGYFTADINLRNNEGDVLVKLTWRRRKGELVISEKQQQKNANKGDFHPRLLQLLSECTCTGAIPVSVLISGNPHYLFFTFISSFGGSEWNFPFVPVFCRLLFFRYAFLLSAAFGFFPGGGARHREKQIKSAAKRESRQVAGKKRHLGAKKERRPFFPGKCSSVLGKN